MGNEKKQEYAIFAKDSSGVFCLVRSKPTDELLEYADVTVLEVKMVPQEMTLAQVEKREQELKQLHKSFKKAKGGRND